MAEINAQRNSLRAEMAEHRMKRPTEMLRDMARPRKPKAMGCGICNQDISAEQESDICGCGAGFHRECLGDRDRCPVCLAPLKAPEDED